LDSERTRTGRKR